MSSTNIITSLGAADLDTKKLVSDLVTAVREPRQKLIDEAKKKAEVAISSVALLKSALAAFQESATELGSVSKLNKLSITNSNTGVVVAEPGGTTTAVPGNHTLNVTQLATSTRLASAGFATAATVVSPTTFTLTLDKAINIPAGTTVAGLVSAINSSGSAVSARLVNTGAGSAPYQIVLEGATGASNNFTASMTAVSGTPNAFTAGASTLTMSDVSGIWVGAPISGTGIAPGTTVTAIDATTKQITLSTPTTDASSGSYTFGNLFSTRLQTAQNATFTLNGITMTRSSNLVSDALEGVSLRLNSTTGATPVQIGVTFDGTEIAAAVSRFAESYNLLNDFIKAATGPASEDNELAGTLQNNSSVRTIKNMLRNKLTARSSSASGDITHWSVLGVALDRNGVLQVDQAKVKENFESKPTDVIKALSNNAASPYIFSGSPSGLAGDMAVAVYGMVRSTGTLADLQKSYADTQARTEKQQTKLDQDIERLEARYDRQFSALNAVLASFKETAKRLDSTFNQNKD